MQIIVMYIIVPPFSCVSPTLSGIFLITLIIIIIINRVNTFSRTRYSAAKGSSSTIELQHNGHTVGRAGNSERSSDGRCFLFLRNYFFLPKYEFATNSLTSTRSTGIQSVLHNGFESTDGVVAVSDGG